MKRRERTGSTARASRPPGLAAVLASPALAKLVLFFLSFEDAAPGTRELQRRTSLGSRSLQNELKRMLRFGWVRRERDGRAVRIVADWTHPAWRHLGGLAGTAAEPAEWREIMRGNEDYGRQVRATTMVSNAFTRVGEWSRRRRDVRILRSSSASSSRSGSSGID
ncbi:MAG: hypothetical protein ACREM1_16645 [Longimicrobiales bacterium]